VHGEALVRSIPFRGATEAFPLLKARKTDPATGPHAAFARRTGIDYPPLPTPELASSNQRHVASSVQLGTAKRAGAGSALVGANGIFFHGSRKTTLKASRSNMRFWSEPPCE
jgi:hypothetical protein